MRDNALYFPYISVPNVDWTIKTLFYWDKLSSIVPMDHIDAPEQFSPFMLSLVQEDLVEQIFPARYLNQIPDFEKCFIKLIRYRLTRYRQLKSQDLSVCGSRGHSKKTAHQTSIIHAEKLGEIPEFLIEVGLAKRLGGAWYEVNSWAANLFMAYLASCLGALGQINAAPVTNKTLFLGMFGNLTPRYKVARSKHHSKARDVILRSLLPVPSEKVTLDELLKFKSDHGQLLPDLRRSIEAHCSIVATLPNAEDRINVTEQFVSECKGAVDEITDAMKPTWNNITFGSIAPLFGAGFTLAATANANELAGYAGSSFTFAACAYQAISSIRGNREAELNKPLAYITHANRRFIA